MAEIDRLAKPLSINPLKASPALGAALAALGLRNAVPLLHGSQGCTAFAKVFFVRHFREPIPLQTTAMDLTSTVMSADPNVLEALKVICGKSKPEIVVLASTGLSETQGTDLGRLVHEFRAASPEFEGIDVIPVNAPDYVGCLESGFAATLEATLDRLVPETRHAGRRHKQVNVLCSSALTPGDGEAIKDWIEAFGLRPVLVPDVADSLDGHLIDAEFTPLSFGGTPRSEIATLGEAAATLVIGRSATRAADLLKARSGVPDFRFDHLMGLDAGDAFTQTLAQIAGHPVPPRIERQRAQLLDAMVDTHFMLGFARVALALDPDLLHGFASFLTGVGAEVVTAVAPARAEVLLDTPCERVRIGDFADLETAAAGSGAALLVANSHGVQSAERLGVPLLRAGFPLYDQVGGYARGWVGYRGARQALFDIANLLQGQHHGIPAYRSIYRTGPAPAGAGVVRH